MDEECDDFVPEETFVLRCICKKWLLTFPLEMFLVALFLLIFGYVVAKACVEVVQEDAAAGPGTRGAVGTTAQPGGGRNPRTPAPTKTDRQSH